MEIIEQFAVEDIWCAAVAADRINGGYVKSNQFQAHGTGIKANRSVIYEILAGEADPWTEKDAKTAKEYHQYWRNQMLLLLDDNANQYHRAVAKSSNKNSSDSVDRSDISVIASAVSATRNLLNRERVDQKKKSCSRNYVGCVKDRVELSATVIDSRWVERVGAYANEAVTDNDCLVQWWKDTAAEVGTVLRMQARVKACSLDYFTQVPSTQLNYIKILSKEPAL